MTKSRAGVVSVIRDLTLDEARSVYERLDPWYGHVSYRGGSSRMGQDGDIEVREVFGPAGWSMADLHAKHWPRLATPEEQKQRDEQDAMMRAYYDEEAKSHGKAKSAPKNPTYYDARAWTGR